MLGRSAVADEKNTRVVGFLLPDETGRWPFTDPTGLCHRKTRIFGKAEKKSR